MDLDIQLSGTFIDYHKTLMSLMVALKELREFSQKLNLEKSIQLLDDVLERIEKKSFSVAVVGEFKRGKSTFINALLGQQILPSDILPTTATLNRVTYGLQPLVKVFFKDGREEEVPIDKLEDYVTKLTPEGEETAAQVGEAVVYYPIHYCQNNVDIIDTPGLNDETNMTEITLSVLPEVDAAIMVVMAQAPLSEYEREFLETKLLTNDLGRIIFVVTGIDRYNNPQDADRGINYVKDRIQKHVLQRAKERYGDNSPEYETYKKKIGTPRVFGLSAYQALQAKSSNDSALLDESRFCEFEEALEEFLTQEKGATFLQVPVNRAIASATEILKTVNLQENALNMKQEEFREAYDESVAEIKALRERNAKEMKQIDAAAEDVKTRVRPYVWELENVLKRSAEEEIAQIEIRSAELGNQNDLAKKLGHKVSNAVQKAASQQAEKIQSEIEQGLVKEVERLQDFAHSINLTLKNIEMQFVSVEASSKAKTTTAGEGLAAALAVFTGFGGIWSGYREAGIKGGAVGAAGSFGTAFAAGVVATAIGLPITFPVVAVVGIVSFFTGGQLAKAVFGGQRVENFKANYQEAVLSEIDKQLKENRINQKVDTQISEIFQTLKQKVHAEVESLLDNTQNTLAELRAKRERDEVLTEQQHQELEKIRTRTERILGSAQGLSQQLLQQVNVLEATPESEAGSEESLPEALTETQA